MNHESVQSMMFHFLKGIDYSKQWEEVELGMRYDLGDYNFPKNEDYQKVRLMAKVLWAILNP